MTQIQVGLDLDLKPFADKIALAAGKIDALRIRAGTGVTLNASLNFAGLTQDLDSIKKLVQGQTAIIKVGTEYYKKGSRYAISKTQLKTQFIDPIQREIRGDSSYKIKVGSELFFDKASVDALRGHLRTVLQEFERESKFAVANVGTLRQTLAQLTNVPSAKGLGADDLKRLAGKASQFGINVDVSGSITALRSQLKQGFREAGDDAILGLAKGLIDDQAMIQKATKDVVDRILGDLKKGLGIASPSKEGEKIGRWTFKGFGQGFAAEAGQWGRQASVTLRTQLANVGQAASKGLADGWERDRAARARLLQWGSQAGNALGEAFGKAAAAGAQGALVPGLKGGLLGATGGFATGGLIGGVKALGGAAQQAVMPALMDFGSGGMGQRLGMLGKGATALASGGANDAFNTFLQQSYDQILHAALNNAIPGALLGAAGVAGVAGLTGFAKGASGSMLQQTLEAIKDKIFGSASRAALQQADQLVAQPQALSDSSAARENLSAIQQASKRFSLALTKPQLDLLTYALQMDVGNDPSTFAYKWEQLNGALSQKMELTRQQAEALVSEIDTNAVFDDIDSHADYLGKKVIGIGERIQAKMRALRQQLDQFDLDIRQAGAGPSTEAVTQGISRTIAGNAAQQTAQQALNPQSTFGALSASAENAVSMFKALFSAGTQTISGLQEFAKNLRPGQIRNVIFRLIWELDNATSFLGREQRIMQSNIGKIRQIWFDEQDTRKALPLVPEPGTSQVRIDPRKNEGAVGRVGFDFPGGDVSGVVDPDEIRMIQRGYLERYRRQLEEIGHNEWRIVDEVPGVWMRVKSDAELIEERHELIARSLLKVLQTVDRNGDASVFRSYTGNIGSFNPFDSPFRSETRPPERPPSYSDTPQNPFGRIDPTEWQMVGGVWTRVNSNVDGRDVFGPTNGGGGFSFGGNRFGQAAPPDPPGALALRSVPVEFFTSFREAERLLNLVEQRLGAVSRAFEKLQVKSQVTVDQRIGELQVTLRAVGNSLKAKEISLSDAKAAVYGYRRAMQGLDVQSAEVQNLARAFENLGGASVEARSAIERQRNEDVRYIQETTKLGTKPDKKPILSDVGKRAGNLRDIQQLTEVNDLVRLTQSASGFGGFRGREIGNKALNDALQRTNLAEYIKQLEEIQRSILPLERNKKVFNAVQEAITEELGLAGRAFRVLSDDAKDSERVLQLARNAWGTISDDFENLVPQLLVFAVAYNLVIQRVLATPGAVLQAAAAYDRLSTSIETYLSATRGIGDASGVINDLQGVALDLGIGFENASKGFLKFAAATQGTSLEGQEVDITRTIATAGRNQGLGGEQIERASNALTQILSKGQVQSEELRGQLAEALPGALQVSARAFGVTTKELYRMVEAGQVAGDEFVSKFIGQLKAEGAAVSSLAGSFSNVTEQLGSSFQALMASMGEPFLAPLTLALQGVNAAIKALLPFGGLLTAGLLTLGSAAAKSYLGIKSWTGVAKELLQADSSKSLFSSLQDDGEKVGQGLKKGLDRSAGIISDAFRDIGRGVRGIITQDLISLPSLSKVGDGFRDIGAAATRQFGVAAGAAQGLGNSIRLGLAGAFDVLREDFEFVKNASVRDAFDVLREDVEFVKNASVRAFGDLANGIKRGLGSAREGVSTVFGSLVQTAQQKLSSLSNVAADAFGDLAGAARGRLEPLRAVAASMFSDLVDKARGRLGNLPTVVADAFGGFADVARERLGTLRAVTATQISDLVDTARERLGTLQAVTAKAFADLADAAKGRLVTLQAEARNAFDDLVDGAKRRLDTLQAVSANAFADLSDGIRERLGTLRAAATNSFDGLVEATRGRLNSFRAAVADAFSGLVDTARGRLGTLQVVTADAFAPLSTRITALMQPLQASVGGAFGHVADTLTSKLAGIKAAVSGAFADNQTLNRFKDSFTGLQAGASNLLVRLQAATAAVRGLAAAAAASGQAFAPPFLNSFQAIDARLAALRGQMVQLGAAVAQPLSSALQQAFSGLTTQSQRLGTTLKQSVEGALTRIGVATGKVAKGLTMAGTAALGLGARLAAALGPMLKLYLLMEGISTVIKLAKGELGSLGDELKKVRALSEGEGSKGLNFGQKLLGSLNVGRNLADTQTTIQAASIRQEADKSAKQMLANQKQTKAAIEEVQRIDKELYQARWQRDKAEADRDNTAFEKAKTRIQQLEDARKGVKFAVSPEDVQIQIGALKASEQALQVVIERKKSLSQVPVVDIDELKRVQALREDFEKIAKDLGLLDRNLLSVKSLGQLQSQKSALEAQLLRTDVNSSNFGALLSQIQGLSQADSDMRLTASEIKLREQEQTYRKITNQLKVQENIQRIKLDLIQSQRSQLEATFSLEKTRNRLNETLAQRRVDVASALDVPEERLAAEANLEKVKERGAARELQMQGELIAKDRQRITIEVQMQKEQIRLQTQQLAIDRQMLAIEREKIAIAAKQSNVPDALKQSYARQLRTIDQTLEATDKLLNQEGQQLRNAEAIGQAQLSGLAIKERELSLEQQILKAGALTAQQVRQIERAKQAISAREEVSLAAAQRAAQAVETATTRVEEQLKVVRDLNEAERERLRLSEESARNEMEVIDRLLELQQGRNDGGFFERMTKAAQLQNTSEEDTFKLAARRLELQRQVEQQQARQKRLELDFKQKELKAEEAIQRLKIQGLRVANEERKIKLRTELETARLQLTAIGKQRSPEQSALLDQVTGLLTQFGYNTGQTAGQAPNSVNAKTAGLVAQGDFILQQDRLIQQVSKNLNLTYGESARVLNMLFDSENNLLAVRAQLAELDAAQWFGQFLDKSTQLGRTLSVLTDGLSEFRTTVSQAFTMAITNGQSAADAIADAGQALAGKVLTGLFDEMVLKPMESVLFQGLAKMFNFERPVTEQQQIVANTAATTSKLEGVGSSLAQEIKDGANRVVDAIKAIPGGSFETPRYPAPEDTGYAMPQAGGRSPNLSVNEQALLDTLSFAEGTWNSQTKSPRYDLTYGYQKIDTKQPHPDRVVRSGKYASAAAGAYQFMPATWELANSGKNPAMLPETQDFAALNLIQRRGVDPDERFSRSMSNKLAPEWASLPTLSGKSFYNQPVKKFEDLMKFYDQRVRELSGGASQNLSTPPTTAPAAITVPSLPQPQAAVALPVVPSRPAAAGSPTSYPLPADFPGLDQAVPVLSPETAEQWRKLGKEADSAANALKQASQASPQPDAGAVAAGLDTEIKKVAEKGKEAGQVAGAVNKNIQAANKTMTGLVQGFTSIALAAAGIEQLGKGGIYNTLMGLASLFGSLSSIFSMFIPGTGIFGGTRAKGGTVDPSKTYLVGERGPELFMPTTGGQIIPNSDTESILSALGGRRELGASPMVDPSEMLGLLVQQTRAMGGPVNARKNYLVGEQGPELFVPNLAERMSAPPEPEMDDFAASRGSLSSSIMAMRERRAEQTMMMALEAPTAPLNIKYESSTINGVEYVTAEQFQKGMRDAAERGRALTMSALKNNVRSRRQVGI